MLQGELFAERKNREETYDKIIKRLGNDVLRVNDILNNEKKVREETHSGLLKLLEDMHLNMHHQISVILFFRKNNNKKIDRKKTKRRDSRFLIEIIGRNDSQS